MGLNGQRWIRMLSESVVNQPRYTVCSHLSECVSVHMSPFFLQDVYLYKMDDVMILTGWRKGWQMVSCLSVSIKILTEDSTRRVHS